MKKRISYIGMILLFAGIFILPYAVRKEIISVWSNRTFFGGICWIAWLGAVLLIAGGSARLFENKGEWIFVILPFIAFMLLSFNILSNDQSIGFIILYSSCCVFPIYIIFINFVEESRVELIKIFLTLLDICIVIAVAWAIIDTAFDKIILKQIAPLMKHSPVFMDFAYPDILDGNRYYSLWGHPVFNATIFNMFYVLNIVYGQSRNERVLPDWLVCLMSLSGVGCCGSKTGIVVVIMITVIVFYRDKRLLIVAATGLLIVLLSGLGNNLITRFLTQSLTTGRASALKALMGDKTFHFSLFKGYGSIEAAVEKGYNAAFEFPFVKFSFNYGLVFAMIILGTFFVYITYKLLKKGTVRVWILWGLIFAEVNTYSTFAEDRDNFMVFCIFTMILLNIGYILQNEKSKDKTGAI